MSRRSDRTKRHNTGRDSASRYEVASRRLRPPHRPPLADTNRSLAATGWWPGRLGQARCRLSKFARRRGGADRRFQLDGESTAIETDRWRRPAGPTFRRLAPTAWPANRRRSCRPGPAPTALPRIDPTAGRALPSKRPVPPRCRRGRIDRSLGSRPRRRGKAARCLAGQIVVPSPTKPGYRPHWAAAAPMPRSSPPDRPACRHPMAEHAAVSPNAAEAFSIDRRWLPDRSRRRPGPSVPRPTATIEIRATPAARSRPAAADRRPLRIYRATSSRRAAVARLGRRGRWPRPALPPAWLPCRRTLIYSFASATFASVLLASSGLAAESAAAGVAPGSAFGFTSPEGADGFSPDAAGWLSAPA